jgi:5-(carboxyamino)imidazole ribonucleotide mutase
LTASAGIRWIKGSEETKDEGGRMKDERRTQTAKAGSKTVKDNRKRVRAKPGKAQDDSSSSFILHPSSLPLVAVVMGSKSDWETMRHADQALTDFGVPHECHVMSAHRTPALAAEFASNAESRGVEVMIAAAGGAAHLAGVIAAHTILPVLGVPMKSDALNGLDSLLSTVQMPAGIPVGTLAIGKSGAVNAALLAIAILANSRPDLRKKLHAFRQEQERKIRQTTLE